MPHKKSKKLKEKLREKRKAEQVKQARKERKRVERKRRIKRKVKKPVREVKQAGGQLKEAGSEAAKLARAKTPGVSSFQQRASKSASSATKKQREDNKPLDTDRERKIVIAQQLRNEGLTLNQVASQIDMSASWVSKNTVPPTQSGGSSQQQAQDTGGSFLDDLSDTFASIEGDIFGETSGEGSASGGDKSFDEDIASIDEQFGMDDGDFDIDLDGID